MLECERKIFLPGSGGSGSFGFSSCESISDIICSLVFLQVLFALISVCSLFVAFVLPCSTLFVYLNLLDCACVCVCTLIGLCAFVLLA